MQQCPAFSLHGQEGIVVFMARDGVNLRLLQSQQNDGYLKAVTDFAGAAYALRAPRKEKESYRERAEAWRRVRSKILTMVREGKSFEQVVKENSAAMRKKRDNSALKSSEETWLGYWMAVVKGKLERIVQKIRGGGAQSPPIFQLETELSA